MRSVVHSTLEATVDAGPPTEYAAADVLAEGQRVGDLELLRKLGHGSFAQVFLARQDSLQRLVAVKISHNVGTEPQTLAQLDHEHIVRVFDQRLLDDGRLRLLLMQYVPGGTLLDVVHHVRATPPDRRDGQLLLDSVDTVLERSGEIRPTGSRVREEIAALSWPETVAWLGRQLADALDYAGDHGVLHRDIKPANVLLTEDGVPKLADFNVSSSDTVRQADPVGWVGGSLAYMSPEQLDERGSDRSRRAAVLDTCSDIYALAVLLWEMLTGLRPFDDDHAADRSVTTPAVMAETRRRGVDPVTRSALPADCPAALRRVLVTCLAPAPGDRWSSGAELARQFALCLDAHARDLVDPPRASRRSGLCRWAVPILLCGIGIPNLLAAGYSYYYNTMVIIDTLSPHVQQRLEQVYLAVDAVVFPLGAVLILLWCRLPLTVPRGLHRGRIYRPEALARARKATLLLGHHAILVGFALWVVAGLAYLIALQIAAGGIPLRAYPHLIASLAVCGAVGVAYPYFLLTLYAIRCLYPILVSHGEIGSIDGHELRRLRRQSTRCLAVAASVPLGAITGLRFIGTDIPGSVSPMVRALCLGGVVAFLVMYRLYRSIDRDLRALDRVVSGKFATTIRPVGQSHFG